jgi:hypothetical protein
MHALDMQRKNLDAVSPAAQVRVAEYSIFRSNVQCSFMKGVVYVIICHVYHVVMSEACSAVIILGNDVV